ncbi:MAG: DUF3461 family protein [bacterium]
MSEYKSLKQLGINNPNEIDRYSLQTVNNVDILRVVYRRKKGSLLPDSKKFRFVRTEKIRGADTGPRGTWIDYEVSPFIRDVMGELDQIVRAKHDREHKFDVLREEISRLEEENAHRLAYIKSLVDEL